MSKGSATEVRNKDVEESNSENTNDQLSNNIKLLNDRFYTICLNYAQSISDIQKECIEIIENNVKANKRFQEMWFSDKNGSSDVLKRYYDNLSNQANDYTATVSKINDLGNNLIGTTLDAMKDNITNYNKVFAANHDLAINLTKNWISTYRKNSL